MNRTLVLLLSLLSFAGCSSSSSSIKPEVETDTSGSGWDFAEVYGGPIYLPADAGEVDQKQEEAANPAWQYVDRARLTNPTYTGFERVPALLRGFSCPVRGRVLVAFLVDEGGDLISPRAAGSIHPDCDARAVAAVDQAMRFTPAVLDGEAVVTLMTLPVNFL